jgi:hypothetical protein
VVVVPIVINGTGCGVINGPLRRINGHLDLVSRTTGAESSVRSLVSVIFADRLAAGLATGCGELEAFVLEQKTGLFVARSFLPCGHFEAPDQAVEKGAVPTA